MYHIKPEVGRSLHSKIMVPTVTINMQPLTYMDEYMKPTDIEYLKTITPEIIKAQSDPVLINRLLEIIDDLETEVKRLKRTQGFDIVKGKRQKPLNYIPGKDKI